MSGTPFIIQTVADIVAAYVGSNSVPAAELPQLIQSIHRAITGITDTPASAPAEPQSPAVPPRKSVQPDHIVCLEDGKKFKSLKRHLRTKYNLGPEEYRAKWGLDPKYPMVAPNYAAARSALAKSMGLGQRGRISKTSKRGSKPV